MEVKLTYASTLPDGIRREAAGSIQIRELQPHPKTVDLMLAQLGSQLIDMVEEPDGDFFPDELYDPNIHEGPNLNIPPITGKPWRN